MAFSPAGLFTFMILTREEMLEISQLISRHFSPMFSGRPSRHTSTLALTSNQLLEISEDISRKFAPQLISEAPKIILMPIDPKSLYVYWSLGDYNNIKPSIKSALENQALVVRIYESERNHSEPVKKKNFFDIPVNNYQSSQKLTINPADQINSFTAALVILDADDQLIPIAVSDTAQSPKAVPFSVHIDSSYCSNTLQAFTGNQEILPDNRYNASSRGIN